MYVCVKYPIIQSCDDILLMACPIVIYVQEAIVVIVIVTTGNSRLMCTADLLEITK